MSLIASAALLALDFLYRVPWLRAKEVHCQYDLAAHLIDWLWDCAVECSSWPLPVWLTSVLSRLDVWSLLAVGSLVELSGPPCRILNSSRSAVSRSC